ncbi:MAG: sulfotransferase [Gammaproteobacteria bacterium]|nr:sulfotransferase [Gammaproteobacteria bacterium]
MNKTFVLGVGCQKGGTTWLYRYLNMHHAANMGFKKEYHVFDALYLPEFAHLKSRNTDFYRLFRRWRVFKISKMKEVFKYRCFYRDISCYFNYFSSLVDGVGSISLTGDITPSYAGLPVEALVKIKKELEDRGFAVKVLFIMRDPVERCISSMRMTRRNAANTPENDEVEDLIENYKTPIYKIRTQYEKTIRNIETVFDSHDVHYEFYERLFDPGSIRGITDFLSIDYIEPDFGRKVNVSRTNNLIDDDVKREVFDYYRPTFEFVAERFGRDFIQGLWPSYEQFKEP